MEIKVNHCENCPFCSSAYDDMSLGSAWTHMCTLNKTLSEIIYGINEGGLELFIDNDNKGMPIHPEWCPLLKETKFEISWK